MRFALTTGTLLALLLLVRCGAPVVPVRAPEGAPLVARERAPAPATELARAPHPHAVRAPVRAPDTLAEVEVPHLKRVREIVRSLGTPRCGLGNLVIIDDKTGKPLPNQEPEEVKELRKLGETVHAVYEVVLSDPKSTWTELAGVRIALDYDPAEPRRFVPCAIRRLMAPDALVPTDPEPRAGTPEFQAERLDWTRRMVREEVLALLANIGDERDARFLVPFLYDDDWSLRREAAVALAKIGGQKELDALGAWLSLQNLNDPRVPKFRKIRDEFDARLKAKESAKPRTF